MRSRSAALVVVVVGIGAAVGIAVLGEASLLESVIILLMAAVVIAVLDLRLAVRRVGRAVTSHRDISEKTSNVVVSIDERLDDIPPGLTEVRDAIAAVPAVVEPSLTEIQQLLIDSAVEQSALGEQLQQQLERLRTDLAAFPDLVHNVQRLHERVPRLRDRLLRQMTEESRQVEALLALHALFDLELPPPFSRGWAAHGDLLLEAVRAVLTERPGLVLECGSGTSSIWLGYACRQLGERHRVVSLEHDPEFADQTRQMVDQHGLNSHVDIRTAPLQPYQVLDTSMLWYSLDAVADVISVDLMLVDGPPKATQAYARLPAVPLLRDRLHPGTLVLLDDAKREEEEVIAKRWHEALPRSELAIDLTFARGLATLRIG